MLLVGLPLTKYDPPLGKPPLGLRAGSLMQRTSAPKFKNTLGDALIDMLLVAVPVQPAMLVKE